MLIAIDIGNTMIKIGLFEGESLKEVFSTKSDQSKSYEEYQATMRLFLLDRNIDPNSVDQAIVSSVVPTLGVVWKKLLSSLFPCRPLVLGPKLKTGMRIVTDNPKEVGSDLIADGVGALEKYGPSTCIADFGTATKLILIDKNGSWAGCTIGPGVKLGMISLNVHTSALPEVAMSVPEKVVGRNTNDSLNSALTYGNAFAIKGLADAFEKEVGYPLKRVLTGGYASIFQNLLADFSYEPTLSLEGLRIIHGRNCK